MMEYFKTKRRVLSLSAILLILYGCCDLVNSQPIEFRCEKNAAGERLPALPTVYSTDMRLNFPKQQYSIEARHVLNGLQFKEAFEFISPKRHVKYIRHGSVALFITYSDDDYPKCTVKKMDTDDEIFDTEDRGPSEIISRIIYVIGSRDDFTFTDVSLNNGIYVRRLEGCFKYPQINVSLEFSFPGWNQSRTSALQKKTNYLVKGDAQVGDNYVGILFHNFDPNTPDDAEFQPPENTFCDGFKANPKLPPLPNYFSYNAEIIVYESPEGVAPIVSHRTVYYDYLSGLSRSDFYDPLAENEDIFSPVRARQKSIIHDFNSGVEYTIDPLTGTCAIDSFQTTLSVITVKEKMDKMPDAKKYFSLDEKKMSMNGQYPTRGLMSDVYTGTVSDTNEIYVYTWYFSTNKTQVVDKGNVEKNVLLRMVVRPTTGSGKDGAAEINFYNFMKNEPSVSKFDLTGCYNESFSKTLVLTFPGNEQLKGLESLLKLRIHIVLKDVIGISKQRISVQEVSITEKYIYALFKLLDLPSAIGVATKPDLNEPTLADAYSKLKNAVEKKNISITVVPKSGKAIVLRPEPDGLNVFSGDRKTSAASGYKEGSVIGLTIVMLVLGIILGGITVNLIISKKYGVSLFQKSSFDSFNNPLNESSM